MKVSISAAADFSLVGSGEAYGNCGSIFAVGCLNVEAHKGVTLDGVDMGGKAVIKYVRNSCHRPVCPVCWGSWANRECDSVLRRLAAFKLKNSHGKFMKPIHIIVSVPYDDYGLSLQGMRDKVYKALKRTGCIGGVLIYHPKRRGLGGWVFSPHFHVVGYGWIRDTRRNYVHSGYIVKNVGIRKNVRGTVYYQLSHCGVREGLQTVTWFGLLCYRKLKVPRIAEQPLVCPLCGDRLRRLVYIGEGSDILGSWHVDVESGFYFEEDRDWMYKANMRSGEPEGCEILGYRHDSIDVIEREGG